MRKGGKGMRVEERIAALEKENQKLREDNEKLMNIIRQMKVTMNRLIDRCLVQKQEINEVT